MKGINDLEFLAKLKLVDKPNSMVLAWGEVVVNGCLVLKKIVVRKSKDGGSPWVAFPSQKNEKTQEYEQFYLTITKESRDKLTGEVINKYESLMEKEPI